MKKMLNGNVLITPLKEETSSGGIIIKVKPEEETILKGIVEKSCDESILKSGSVIIYEKFGAKTFKKDGKELCFVSINRILATIEK